MTSKERVTKVFNFEIPDRIPIYDLIHDGFYPRNDFDIVLLDETNYKQIDIEHKFKMRAIMDPFEDLSCAFGLEHLLERIAKDPILVFNEFKRSADKTLEQMEKELSLKKDIDGIWLWSDMAYKKGLLFSESFYRSALLPLHKKMCTFFKLRNLPIVIHSDGNLNSILPDLVKAGFNGLHPVEFSSGMNLEKLKITYKKKMVFLGGFERTLLKYGTLKDIKKRLDVASNGGGYIFGFESPIDYNIDIERYKNILNTVKAYGRTENKSYIR